MAERCPAYGEGTDEAYCPACGTRLAGEGWMPRERGTVATLKREAVLEFVM